MGPSKKMCNFHSVILVLTFINIITADICQNNVCKCDSQFGKYGSIDCNCNGSKQDLVFTHDELQGNAFNEVNKVTVTNCDGAISFSKDSFKDVKKLNSLNIKNVKQAKFDTGVFHQLNFLQLVNVQQLDFSTNAFNGAHGLAHIQIIGPTMIPELPEYCFYKMEGLQRMVLTNITIDNIKKNALNLQLSKFVIDDCTINSIQEDGITLTTSNFIISKSTMKEMTSNSIKVISDTEVAISGSKFETKVPANAIRITTPMLNISSNIFKNFQTEMISNTNITNNGKIYFTGNTFSEFELGASLEKITPFFGKTEMKENKFPCMCSLVQSLSLLPDSPIRENNFCIANCKVSLAEVQDIVNKKKLCGSELNNAIICENRPTIPTTTTLTTILSSTRDGKHQHFTTTETPTTKAGNSGDRIQITPLNILLSSLAVAVFSHFC